MKNQITERESITINLMKFVAIFSVIAAHTVGLSSANFYSSIVSSLWTMFGKVGVVVFFLIGGFLYNRKPKDTNSFWKKKLCRLIIPWLICSVLTFAVSLISKASAPRIDEFLCWIFGSGTWYYYFTVNLLFMFLFKWIYKHDVLLLSCIGLQIVALMMSTSGISTTPPIPYLTDFLNPLHWIGYFSLGILIRRYRIDRAICGSRVLPIIASIILVIMSITMHVFEIHTYFNMLTCIYSICAGILITKLSNFFARFGVASFFSIIGKSSYFIYLIHMQVVQFLLNRIHNGNLKATFAPFIGLLIMILILFPLIFIFNMIPYGKKIKTFIGL